MNEQETNELLDRFASGEANPEEQARLAERMSLDDSLAARLKQKARLEASLTPRQEIELTQSPRRYRLVAWAALAAAIVLGVWLWPPGKTKELEPTLVQAAPQVVEPSGSGSLLTPRRATTAEMASSDLARMKKYLLPQVDWVGLTVPQAIEALQAEIDGNVALSNHSMKLDLRYEPEENDPRVVLQVRREHVRLLPALRYLAAVSQRELVFGQEEVRFVKPATDQQTFVSREVRVATDFLLASGSPMQPEALPLFTALDPFPLLELVEEETAIPEEEVSDEEMADLDQRLASWGIEAQEARFHPDRSTVAMKAPLSQFAILEATRELTSSPRFQAEVAIRLWEQPLEHNTETEANVRELSEDPEDLSAYWESLPEQGTNLVMMPRVVTWVQQSGMLESTQEVLTTLPNEEGQDLTYKSWTGSRMRVYPIYQGGLFTLGFTFESRGDWLGMVDGEPQFESRHAYRSYLRFDGSSTMEVSIPGEKGNVGVIVSVKLIDPSGAR